MPHRSDIDDPDDGGLPAWDLDADLIASVAAGGPARVRVRRCAGAQIVVGRGGRAGVEVDLAAARAAGVPVLRRPGGGCAVLLDRGNLVVSLVAPMAGVGGVTSAFRAATAWLVDGLAGCGVAGVAGEGVSDLVLDDRKVGGSCIQRTRGLVYYSTTLLLDPDLDLMERVLPHPPREPRYRRGRRHREFLGRIGLPPEVGPEDFAERLFAELAVRMPHL
jgi:lipoate-protein ligase A